MNGLQSSLYTVAIALCVFSAGIIRDRQSSGGRPLAWFSAFLLLATLGFSFELLSIHPAAPFKSLWLGLRMVVGLLIAPCLWLTIKESVEGVRPRLASLGRANFITILAGLALLVPLIENAHAGLEYHDPANLIGAGHARVIHATMLACIAIFAVQVSYFLPRAHRLLLSHSASPRWLQLPLAVVFTAWLVGLSRTLQRLLERPGS